jgi:hypothetical protein
MEPLLARYLLESATNYWEHIRQKSVFLNMSKYGQRMQYCQPKCKVFLATCQQVHASIRACVKLAWRGMRSAWPRTAMACCEHAHWWLGVNLVPSVLVRWRHLNQADRLTDWGNWLFIYSYMDGRLVWRASSRPFRYFDELQYWYLHGPTWSRWLNIIHPALLIIMLRPVVIL